MDTEPEVSRDRKVKCSMCESPATQFVLTERGTVTCRCDYHGYDKLVSKTSVFILREEALSVLTKLKPPTDKWALDRWPLRD